MDVEGCEDDVAALNAAVDLMAEKLRDEQLSESSKHVVRPNDARRRGVKRSLHTDLTERV
jgi:hypothetical protein